MDIAGAFVDRTGRIIVAEPLGDKELIHRMDRKTN
jgi:hypothetical protein